MKCRICENELRPPSPEEHVHERSPVDVSICLGCFVISVELKKWLVRAADRTVMGDWTSGWLREILKQPERYR